MEKLKELAQSVYGDTVIEWLDEQITALSQPEKIPSDNLSDVKAHKKYLTWLKDQRDMFRSLKENEPNESFGEYE